MGRAWAFLVIDDDDRNYMGNAGYEDVLGEHYNWDSTVPNGRYVEPGDLIVLRDGKYLLGFAWVDSIDKWPGTKDRYRCPTEGCGCTKFKRLTTQETLYRCGRCKKGFDEPIIDLIEVTYSRAHYGRTWVEFETPIPDRALDSAFVSQARQNAIRELRFDEAKNIIDAAQYPGSLWWLSDTTTKKKIPGGFVAVIGKVRIGQQRFRQEMLARFENRCVICGPLPIAMLDAAHIYRYADAEKHLEEGGLLMRRDLHTLFDRYEILIDPDTDWHVWVFPGYEDYDDVWRFNGKPLKAKPEARPDPKYLQIHAAVAREKWNRLL